MNTINEQRAQEYAYKTIASFGDSGVPNGIKDIKQMIADGYVSGYTACEQSMWHSTEEELPEDMVSVLVRCSDTDPNFGYSMACRINGSWHI